MTAATSWWFCGKCGFRNHPRMNQNTALCEQCGHNSQPAAPPAAGSAEAAALANDTDYKPS